MADAATEASPAVRSWAPPGLVVRITSGVVIGLAVLGLLLIGIWGVVIIVAIAGGLALWEFRGLSARMGFRAPSWLLFPLGAFFAYGPTLLKGVSIETVLGFALVLGSTTLLFVPGRRQGLGRWAMGLAGAVYVGLPFNYYLRLYTAQPSAHGIWWIVTTVVAVVAMDVSALLVGSRLGRTPLMPAISPKKTWEGAIAGMVASIIVVLVGGFAFLGLTWWQAIAIGVLIGAAAVLGDLVESQMKRMARVKDSSHLIPGHGGVLDRLDSLLFPPIVVYLFAYYVGILH
ncbi:MAG TPA: phosphatidate cytidylyltransferase [Candidatus Dormibacteraeota bacterium]